MTPKGLKGKSMTVEEREKSSTDESQDEAVSLFSQIADSDSDKDSELQSDETQLDDEEVNEESTDDESNESEQGDDDETDTGSDDEDVSDEESNNDPWSSVPESLRSEHYNLKERFDHLQNDHRANAGRVSALNRKLSELQQQLESRESERSNTDTQSGPTADDLKGKTFAQVEEEWPEVAEFVRHQVNQVQSQFQQQLTPIQQMRQQIEAEQQQRATQVELDRLAEVHPDFQDVARDPSFNAWVQQQPPGVQQLYGSSLADDNIVLLNLYKGSQATRQEQQSQGTDAGKQSKLQDYAEIPKKGAGRAAAKRNNENVDPVQLFNQIVNQKG